MQSIGFDLVASLVVALVVIVIVATMILNEDPRDRGALDYRNAEAGDSLKTRSSHDTSD